MFTIYIVFLLNASIFASNFWTSNALNLHLYNTNALRPLMITPFPVMLHCNFLPLKWLSMIHHILLLVSSPFSGSGLYHFIFTCFFPFPTTLHSAIFSPGLRKTPRVECHPKHWSTSSPSFHVALGQSTQDSSDFLFRLSSFLMCHCTTLRKNLRP